MSKLDSGVRKVPIKNELPPNENPSHHNQTIQSRKNSGVGGVRF